MRLFDLATWVAAVILVLGSSVVFVWFLRDAGKVLRGEDKDSRRERVWREKGPGGDRE